jgi:hypothetical protein
MTLPNDTKIAFRNAYDAMKQHARICGQCRDYLTSGDGDLCATGHAIIAREMAYSETALKDFAIPSTLE